MRIKKTVLLAVLVASVLVIGCGPSEKEVGLTEEIEGLTGTREGLRTRLDEQKAELERIKATPAGILCVARLVVPAEGVTDASNEELLKAEGLYQATFEAYPDDELCKEVKKTHEEIREERGQRAVESYNYLRDGTRKATDKQLEEAERKLEAVCRDFEDTKAAKEAKRLLGKIESEWNKRGRPVNPDLLVKDVNAFAGEVVRFDSYISEADLGYTVQLAIGNTGQAFAHEPVSFLTAAILPGEDDPDRTNEALAAFEKLGNAISRGTPCTAVYRISRTGSVTIVRITLNDGTIYDFQQ